MRAGYDDAVFSFPTYNKFNSFLHLTFMIECMSIFLDHGKIISNFFSYNMKPVLKDNWMIFVGLSLKLSKLISPLWAHKNDQVIFG